MQVRTFLSWTLRLIAAIILAQTLYFKFTGAEESKFIFSTIGMEPLGRYLVGVSELVAALLLVVPRTAWLGGLMGLGVIAGALFFHLTILGIEVQGDGGTLFYLALAVFVCCLGVVVLHRDTVQENIQRLLGKA
ncbi:MAG: DoxX family protein [Bacteroidetes bacterium]|nr:MAG: DoxX family protein [Bacteroidota bacterium]